MKHNLILKLCALSLAAMMCAGLCPEISASAQDTSDAPHSRTDMKEKPVTSNEKELQVMTSGLKAPRVESNMRVWDCIEFGSYPQAEVIPSTTGYDRLCQVKRENGDVIVNSQLYQMLESAKWDDNLDKTVSGTKYRTMTQNNMFQGGTGFYKWQITTGKYELYFKYEPVKWRVLEVKGGKALLLADKVLDYWLYNTSDTATWETSAVRSGTTQFLDRAFTAEEQKAIVNTTVTNKANINYGTSGGNNTSDKVFLLSEDDMYGNKAAAHYFETAETTEDSARTCKSSTYAKARGINSDMRDKYKGNCYWWLRSPGFSTDRAVFISSQGMGNSYGSSVNGLKRGLRPAMWIDLSTANYKSAGTVKYPVISTIGSGSSSKDQSNIKNNA